MVGISDGNPKYNNYYHIKRVSLFVQSINRQGQAVNIQWYIYIYREREGQKDCCILWRLWLGCQMETLSTTTTTISGESVSLFSQLIDKDKLSINSVIEREGHKECRILWRLWLGCQMETPSTTLPTISLTFCPTIPSSTGTGTIPTTGTGTLCPKILDPIYLVIY